jgi:hypothetical protein
MAKKKFVVMLISHTGDYRENEWLVIWAHSAEEIDTMNLNYDYTRFWRGDTYTAKRFKELTGITAGNKTKWAVIGKDGWH